jgi:hypothetical protein
MLGQCWWTSVSGSPLGTHCKYCLAELDKRIEALLPGLTGSSPDSMPPKWGWL